MLAAGVTSTGGPGPDERPAPRPLPDDGGPETPHRGPRDARGTGGPATRAPARAPDPRGGRRLPAARARQGRSGSMFTRILVPVDLGDRSDRPLQTAFALAGQNGGTVRLVHVIQALAGAQDQELQTFYRRLRGSAERKLGEAARRFAEERVPVRADVVIGDPAGEIVRAARTHRATLVVMGSHRVSMRRGGPGWGTISYRVGLRVPCPVLLVK